MGAVFSTFGRRSKGKGPSRIEHPAQAWNRQFNFLPLRRVVLAQEEVERGRLLRLVVAAVDVVELDLAEELKKGNRVVDIPSLFPEKKTWKEFRESREQSLHHKRQSLIAKDIDPEVYDGDGSPSRPHGQ